MAERGTLHDAFIEELRDTYDAERQHTKAIAGNICVLFTANDAYMRELKVFAPADCIVSNTAADNNHALRQIESVMKGNVATSTQFRFRTAGQGTRKDRRP